MTAGLVLEAPSPRQWLDRYLPNRYGGEAPGDGRWLARADLLADESRLLRAAFDRYVADQLPAAAAATFVALGTAGALANAIGFTIAGTGGGFVVDGEAVRWRLHAAGYVDQVRLDGTFLVAGDHPWAALDGVEVVDDPTARLDSTVAALVEAASPLIDACHGLARVGKAGLWNEVADGLGLAALYQRPIPARSDVVVLLEAAVRSPRAAWKARPQLRIADARCGTVFVGQKGGCCLAYTSRAPGADYCSTCSLRDAADCERRVISWLETRAAAG